MFKLIEFGAADCLVIGSSHTEIVELPFQLFELLPGLRLNLLAFLDLVANRP